MVPGGHLVQFAINDADAVTPILPAMRFAFESRAQRFARLSGFDCLKRYYLEKTDSIPASP